MGSQRRTGLFGRIPVTTSPLYSTATGTTGHVSHPLERTEFLPLSGGPASFRADAVVTVSSFRAIYGRPSDVYFCQDCGGANAANAESCRICGTALARERNGAPCQRCGSATAEAAHFCSLCGATTVQPISAAQNAKNAQSDVGDSVVTVNQTSAQVGTEINLGEGLELPDWLKRAAAEQPFDASHQTAINANPYGPLGGGTATLNALHADGGDPPPATDFVLSPQPPLSIPDDAIDALIAQSATGSASTQGTDSYASSANTGADVSDTSTFISENDLPEWIRQIAAADEARKLEEIRLADEQTASSRAAGATDPRNRKPLPGETTTTGPRTSPWLARRDRSDETDSVAADSWGRPAASVEKRDIQQDSVVGTVAAEPQPAPVVVDPVIDAATAPAASAQNRMRMMLMAAIVIAIIAIVAYMVLS